MRSDILFCMLLLIFLIAMVTVAVVLSVTEPEQTPQFTTEFQVVILDEDVQVDMVYRLAGE